MTDDDMAILQASITEGIEQYFEEYDWDGKFKKYLEDK
jgi:hypothetical protein